MIHFEEAIYDAFSERDPLFFIRKGYKLFSGKDQWFIIKRGYLSHNEEEIL